MEDECPVCQSDRYLNPNLRLLVSPCYHRMCDSCIDRLYSLGSGPCPTCKTVVRKAQFMVQTFEDLVVEKEVAVRRRIAKEFNKRREDFPELRAYNDYLEEVEDIAFNLINDTDLPKTEARLAKLRQDNAAFTALNAQRDVREAAHLAQEEERVRREREERAAEARLLEKAERQERERDKKDIIDGLQLSQGTENPEEVIARRRAALQKRHEANKSSQEAAAAAAAHALAVSSAQRNHLLDGAIKNEPHKVLDDEYYGYEDRFVLRQANAGERYVDPGTEGVLRDLGLDVLRAGGYDLGEAQERAIRMSIAGLSIASLG